MRSWLHGPGWAVLNKLQVVNWCHQESDLDEVRNYSWSQLIQEGYIGWLAAPLCLVAVPEACQGRIQKIFLRVGLYFNDKGGGGTVSPSSE